MPTIYIKNLRLRTIIGIHAWERKNKQDIIINLTIELDVSKSTQSDKIEDTLDYDKLTKKIVQKVESSQYNLIEKLSQSVLNIVMEEPLACKCTLRIDKPLALKLADSVAIELTGEK